MKVRFLPKRSLLFLLLPMLSSAIQAQTSLEGLVRDSITREPLPFVNIIYNSHGNGIITDRDGKFTINNPGSAEFLEFRYVGYKDLTIPEEAIKNGMIVELSPMSYQLEEASIYPGENPAHRIIKLAGENRDRNHPEKTGPFAYDSYEKVIFNILPDSAESGQVSEHMPDSIKYGRNLGSTIDLERFLTKQYLFMMELISKRKFLSASRDKEEVIASRIAGLSQPSFTILARQLQSFSFYDDYILIGGKEFLSPLSNGSTEKYYFLLRDTLFTEEGDSVFLISFTPEANRTFDGLEGVIYINSAGYAVQNVIATAVPVSKNNISFSIQQQYEMIDNRRWFPVSLTTDITVKNLQAPGQEGIISLQGIAQSTITNIDIDPVLSVRDFDEKALEVSPDAGRKPEDLWESYRKDPLNEREMETYRVIDSIGKAENVDRTVNTMETLLTGYIPGKYFTADISKFIGFNRYEGFRFGAGGKTTGNVSGFLTLDGYGAYSLRDKDFKYGGGITFNIMPDKQIEFRAGAWHDVTESGGTDYFQVLSLSSSDFFRDYMIRTMDISDGGVLSLSFRTFRFLTGDMSIKRFLITPGGNYSFSTGSGNPEVALTRFDFAEAGLRLRYAFGETFLMTPRGNKFSSGTKYPVFYLNLNRGLNAFGGGFSYWRAEVKISKTFRTLSFGKTSVTLEGGMVTHGVPYNRLYAGNASYGVFTVESSGSFGTMRLNEFVADRFAALYVKHDFGNLLFHSSGKFRPEIALVQNIGFGNLSEGQLHKNISTATYTKGFFETGVLLNNLVRLQPFRYGLGIFYRYGPYAFPETIDNFAFKFTVQFNT